MTAKIKKNAPGELQEMLKFTFALQEQQTDLKQPKQHSWVKCFTRININEFMTNRKMLLLWYDRTNHTDLKSCLLPFTQ